MKQYTFKSNNPKLYLIATPIGNLQEFSPRAIAILQNEVEKIYCEDTRNTIRLLNHFNIKKKLISLNKDNEKTRYQELLYSIDQRESIALVSDAGYPLISDPGYYFVNHLMQELNYDIVPVNGSSAFLSALISSGLDPRHFLFYGFLSHQKNKKQGELESLQRVPYPIIFYESPHRLIETLQLLLRIFNDRQICVAKEMTKIHEQFYRGKMSDIMEEIMKDDNYQFGEYTIVIAGNAENLAEVSLSDEQLIAEINVLIKEQNYKAKQAIDIVANKYHISKNILYNKYHKKD